MKKKIQPKYYDDAQVTCSCGNTFTTGSTQPTIQVEICAQCHPFFTGEMKYVDTLGRVEKFQKKMAAVAGKQYLSKKKRQSGNNKSTDDNQPRTLKQMLQGATKPAAKAKKAKAD